MEVALRSRILVLSLSMFLSGAALADLPLSDVVQVSTGGIHSCSRDSGGLVKCWGANSEGQLGNGTNTDADTAIDVTGLAPGALGVSAGGAHTCIVTAAGGVRCWGQNIAGQLGDGTNNTRFSPVDVVGLSSGVVAVAAGGLHTCALTNAGLVTCWGHNSFGQLGDGAFQNSNVPVQVVGLAGVVAISAGSGTSCALTGAGGMKCWGSNFFGELGYGPFVDYSPSPLDVAGLSSGVRKIASGFNHTCAVVDPGVAKCWGSNGSGQLGSGTPPVRHYTPVDVAGLGAGVAAISAADYHSCALMASGTVTCWGFNELGQLGTGTRNHASTPVDVVGLSGATAISTGGSNSCALATGGGVHCWGYGRSVGHGKPALARSAVNADGLSSGIAAVGGGVFHTCALTNAGGVKCWGDNFSGQLGNGTTNDARTAVDVTGLSSGVVAVAVGGWHTCALTSAGGVKCWGSNLDGRLGNGTLNDANLPVDVSGLASGVTAIAAGYQHSCALTSGGAVKCWGANGSHQLGTGGTDDAAAPQDVSGLGSGVVEIAAGGAHSCARLTGGTVKCWGHNAYGQIGNGTIAPAATPATVSGLSGVTALAMGEYHSCAITATGGVRCWGRNVEGQLGNGTRTDSLVPSEIASLTAGVSAIEAGGFHTCARLANGKASCWGGNWVGQTGNGGEVDGLLPTPALGLDAGILALGLGQSHSCAVTSAGGVKCWGSGERGQLGNGGGTFIRTPVVVLAAGCAQFSDVATSSAFCDNVTWIRNRSVTLGCDESLYCPLDVVMRVAMAAFVNRLGTALESVVLTGQQALGALNAAASPIVCQTIDWTAVGYARRAEVDAVVTFVPAADIGISVELFRSPDAGRTWSTDSTTSSPHHAKANRWANVRRLGSVDLAAGETVRFGILVWRDGGGAAQLVDAACNLRARIGDLGESQ